MSVCSAVCSSYTAAPTTTAHLAAADRRLADAAGRPCKYLGVTRPLSPLSQSPRRSVTGPPPPPLAIRHRRPSSARTQVHRLVKIRETAGHRLLRERQRSGDEAAKGASPPKKRRRNSSQTAKKWWRGGDARVAEVMTLVHSPVRGHVRSLGPPAHIELAEKPVSSPSRRPCPRLDNVCVPSLALGRAARQEARSDTPSPLPR